MTTTNEPYQTDRMDPGQIKTGRPVVRGTQGVVSCGHYLTSIAAMRMLLSGGNAFDAAAAAGFVAAVVEPVHSYSLGAEASIMLYHSASGQHRVLSGQGVAPGRATVELLKSKGFDKVPTGPGPNASMVFTVPGVMDAWLLMLETYGTKTVAEVMAPAVEYAHRGFPVYEFLHGRLSGTDPAFARIKEQFREIPQGGMEVFYDGSGNPPAVGKLLVQRQLAGTLRKMVQAEQDTPGVRVDGIRAARDMFYRGDIARTIVECSERVGGLFSLEDLANYHARFEEPVSTSFMGHEICGQSTWTQGPVLLQALSILEHFDLRAMGHNSPQYIHSVIEALKLAFADRERYYGDPEFARVPIDGLLSKEYAAVRAGLIRAGEACPELPEPGDAWRYSDGVSARASGATPVPPATPADAAGPGDDDTTHFAVIDRDGNMVCATPSGGTFFKSVYFADLGFSFSTRSEMFVLDDQHPNGLQPGKRPRTTLVNYMIRKDGRPIMTVGCPGGDRQAQGNLQIVLNLLVFGMDLQQAVEAPRFVTQSIINSFYPRGYRPGVLEVEPQIPEEVRSSLAALGHKVEEAYPCGFGATVTQRDPESGALSAGADQRRTAYALAW